MATRDWARWRSRWHFERVLAVALVAASACEADESFATRPVAVVDGVVLDASVVEHVAARDELAPPQAHAAAVETLRLYAAARAGTDGEAEPRALLTEARTTQLLRAARARLWLDQGFEATRTASDIPKDDPILARGLANARWVHPRIHRVCQVVVVPAGVTTRDAAVAITADPAWRQRAHAVMDPVADRIARYLPEGDEAACTLLAQIMAVTRPEAHDDDLLLRYEKETGYDFTVCAQTAADGSCRVPEFDAPWTEAVGATKPGTLSGVFEASWGLHLVYLVAVDDPRPQGDPRTDAFVREKVLDTWRAKELETYLDRLATATAVRVAAPQGESP